MSIKFVGCVLFYLTLFTYDCNKRNGGDLSWLRKSYGLVGDFEYLPSLSKDEMRPLISHETGIAGLKIGKLEDDHKELIGENFNNQHAKEHEIFHVSTDFYVTCFSNGKDSTLYFWDTENGNLLEKYDYQRSSRFLITLDEKKLIIFDGVNKINCFNIENHTLVWSATLERNLNTIDTKLWKSPINNKYISLAFRFDDRICSINIDVENGLLQESKVTSMLTKNLEAPSVSTLSVNENCVDHILGLVCLLKSKSQEIQLWNFNLQKLVIGPFPKLHPNNTDLILHSHNSLIVVLTDSQGAIQDMFTVDPLGAGLRMQPSVNDRVLRNTKELEPGYGQRYVIPTKYHKKEDGIASNIAVFTITKRDMSNPCERDLIVHTYSFLIHYGLMKLKSEEILPLNSVIKDKEDSYKSCYSDVNPILKIKYSDDSDLIIGIVLPDQRFLTFRSENLIFSLENALGGSIDDFPLTANSQLELIEIPKDSSLHESLERSAFLNDDFKVRFLSRVKMQVVDTIDFFLDLSSHLKSNHYFGEPRKSTHVLLVATKFNVIFGVDAYDGSILWKNYIPGIRPLNTCVNNSSSKSFQILMDPQSATKAHKLFHSGIVSFFGLDEKCENLLIWNFDPLTGNDASLSFFKYDKNIFTDYEFQGYSMLKVNLPKNLQKRSDGTSYITVDSISHVRKNGRRCLLVSLDNWSNVATFPDVNRKNYIGINIVEKVNNQRISGRIIDLKESNSETWSFNFPKNAYNIKSATKILDIHRLNKEDYLLNSKKVHPFDYPNLVAFAYLIDTIGLQGQSETSLNIVILDSKYGNVLYHGHKENIDSSKPVNIKIIQHNFIATFTNSKSHLVDIVTISLYIHVLDNKPNKSKSFFESILDQFYLLDTPVDYSKNIDDIIVVENAFRLSTTHVDKIIVPMNKFGYLHKSVLMALPDGHILSLPWKIIDPRRSITSSRDKFTDGDVPSYQPEITIDVNDFVNRNKTIMKVEVMISAPTELESTTVVCARNAISLFCGHLFGIHGPPFDMLGPSFDRLIITAVIGVLLILTVVTYYMKSRNIIALQWT